MSTIEAQRRHHRILFISLGICALVIGASGFIPLYVGSGAGGAMSVGMAVVFWVTGAAFLGFSIRHLVGWATA